MFVPESQGARLVSVNILAHSLVAIPSVSVRTCSVLATTVEVSLLALY